MKCGDITLYGRESQLAPKSPYNSQHEQNKHAKLAYSISKPTIFVLLKEWLEQNKLPLPPQACFYSSNTSGNIGKVSKIETYLSAATFERMDRDQAQRDPFGSINLSAHDLPSRSSSNPRSFTTEDEVHLQTKTNQHSTHQLLSPTHPIEHFDIPKANGLSEEREANRRSNGFPPCVPDTGTPRGYGAFPYKVTHNNYQQHGTGFGVSRAFDHSVHHPETMFTRPNLGQQSQNTAKYRRVPHPLDQQYPLRPSDMIWREHGLMPPKEHPTGEKYNIPDEENCSLWIKKVAVTVKERDFFEIITCGAVRTLHIYPPTSDIGTKGAKLVFTEPSSAARFLQEHAENPVRLHGQIITMEYNRNGVRKLGEDKTRVLRIQGPRHELKTEAYWQDFFHSFCRCEFDFAYPRSNIAEVGIMDIRFSRIEGQSQMAMKGFHKVHYQHPNLRICYGPDPCNGS